MTSFLSLFHNPFPAFFESFFWADFAVVCLLVFLFYLIVSRQSKVILENNVLRNKKLFQFRTEVYVNYEKNFFI